MSRKVWLVLIVFLATLGLDQASKGVVRSFEIGVSQVWIPGLFRTMHLQNPGGVLGLAAAWPLPVKLALFLAAAAGMVVVAALWLRRVRHEAWLVPIGLGAMLGGAAGNSLDRIVLGGVTDFLIVGEALVDPLVPLLPGVERTPAFNLADAFLGLGVVALAASVVWAFVRAQSSPEDA